MNRPTAMLALLLLSAGGCATGDGVNRRDSDGSAGFDASSRPDGSRPDGGLSRDAGGGGGGDASTPPGDGGVRCTGADPIPCSSTCGSVGSAPCVDGRLGACEAPAETCDGIDQDCDGTIDEDVPDRPCSTACGGGTTRCEGGRFTSCGAVTPSAETCDGADEDCDGAVDEGLTRSCTSACGVGVETCSGGSFGGCTAPAPGTETCDGTDEDCDGTVDEGLSRACSTACGSGTETCSAGSWGGCSAPAPGIETCDAMDEDCDGAVDEGLSRACSTACGSGTETCSAGSWGGCTAPAPATEACNLRDDDCDGSTDEGFQAHAFDPIPFSELTAQQPPCDDRDARLDVCMTASKRWCHAHAWGCFAGGGAGHLQATLTQARVICFGNLARQQTRTFATVSAGSGITIDSTNVVTRLAQSAVHRYCRSEGYASGVGPTEHASGSMTLTCLPASLANPVNIATSELRDRSCDPVANPNTQPCSSAADSICRDRGYLSGYGPVEWNSSMSTVVCFQSGA